MIKTRAELKAEAKQSLKGKYWYAVGVSLLSSILIAIPSTITSALGQNGMEALASIIQVAVALFWEIPIGVGLVRYFIKLAKGEKAEVGDLFYVYKHNLGNVIITELKQIVFVFLWSLLFIVPGIIKTFQYYMIDYMIAENPSMDSKRAFEITKAAMAGHKFEAFVLGLSFIGWVLLALLTLGIGMIFLMPYMETTYSKYYLALKQTAVENGIATAEEFSEIIAEEN